MTAFSRLLMSLSSWVVVMLRNCNLTAPSVKMQNVNNLSYLKNISQSIDSHGNEV